MDSYSSFRDQFPYDDIGQYNDGAPKGKEYQGIRTFEYKNRSDIKC